MKMNKGCTIGCLVMILIVFGTIFVTYFFYRSHRVEDYTFKVAVVENNMIAGIKIHPSISYDFIDETDVYVPVISFSSELTKYDEISITLNKITVYSNDEKAPLKWESIINEDIFLDEDALGFYRGNPISFNKMHLQDGRTYSMFVDVTVNSRGGDITKTVFYKLICKKEYGYALPT